MNKRQVEPDKLNDVMEFDHVIRVHDDGSISEPRDIWGPDVYEDRYEDRDGIDESSLRDWELLDGFSGQYGYSGPCMHPSEYIGRRLARYILETPGYYVAVLVRFIDLESEEEDDVSGWAVAYLPPDYFKE